MNAVKKIFNALGILLSIVFSLVLAATLLVTPIMSGVSALVQTDTLHSMIRQVDFAALLPADTGDEMADALLQTEFVSDMVLLYVDDVLAALDGEEQRSLNEQALNELAVEHMDELVPIFRPYIAEMAEESVETPDWLDLNWDELLTDEVVAAAVLQYVNENGSDLLAQFPSPEDLGITPEVAEIVAVVRGGALRTVAILWAAVLTVLILLCRWVRFKGFLWTGVVYLLCGLIDLGYASALKGADLASLAAADAAELAGVAPILLSALVPVLMTAAVTITVLGAVFVVIFIAGRLLLRKRKASRKTEELPAAEAQDRFIPGQPEFMPSAQAESLPTVEAQPAADVQSEPPAEI